MTEQAGLGQSERGHDVGDYSLAALIAHRLGRANVTVCVSIPDSGSDPARNALYFVVIQDGLVRASTDRCFTDHREALDHLHRWLRILQRQHDTSFRLFLSPGIDIPAHDADRCNLPDLLAGPYPPVLSSIFFRLSRRSKRRLLIAFVSSVVLVPVLLVGLRLLCRIALALLSLRSNGNVCCAPPIPKLRRYRLIRWVWPLGKPSPSCCLPRCSPMVSMSSRISLFRRFPPSDLGAYRLEFARVARDLVHVGYAQLFAPAGGDSLEAPIWPPRYELFDERIRRFRCRSTLRDCLIFSQSPIKQWIRPSSPMMLRSHLVSRLETLSGAVRSAVPRRVRAIQPCSGCFSSLA